MPPPATIDQRLAFQRRAGDQAERQRAGEVDREDAEREGVVGARGEGRVDQEARRGGGAAEQADGDPGRRAQRGSHGAFLVIWTRNAPRPSLGASGRRSSAIPSRTKT